MSTHLENMLGECRRVVKERSRQVPAGVPRGVSQGAPAHWIVEDLGLGGKHHRYCDVPGVTAGVVATAGVVTAAGVVTTTGVVTTAGVVTTLGVVTTPGVVTPVEPGDGPTPGVCVPCVTLPTRNAQVVLIVVGFGWSSMETTAPVATKFTDALAVWFLPPGT
jgi:hypothetical protein